LIDYLGQCLVDEDSFVRSAAALALGQLGRKREKGKKEKKKKRKG